MSEQPQNEYLRSQIMTASPERLQLMLFDGALRFCEQARQAMTDNDIPTVHDRLIRAQRIVMEMATNLRTDVNPELCSKLSGLYNYVYRLLVDANISHEPAKLDEAIDLLQYQRETWVLLLEKLAEQQRQGDAPAPAAPQSQPARPRPTGTDGPLVGGTLSIEG